MNMYNFILEDIENIKKTLQILQYKLRKIPEERKIITNIEIISKKPKVFIYKPRFQPPFKSLPRKLKNQIHKLLNKIGTNFSDSCKEEVTIMQNIFDLSIENKKSLIFLLENNIHQTDEVFGDYYAEKINTKYKIYNKRRDTIRRELENRVIFENLNEYIEKDAICQIQDQFDELWTQIINKIDSIEIYFKNLKENAQKNQLILVKELIGKKECEFLEFKSRMYDLHCKDKKRKLKQRMEFLKDVLSLVNISNTSLEEHYSYLLIGLGEKDEIYDGNHYNIEFNNFQTLNQLLDEFITPKLLAETQIYYISGNRSKILLEQTPKPNLNRNILIKIKHNPEIIYEIKKKIGAPNLGICEYFVGTSFTRDESHTRNLTQEDREKIMERWFEIDHEYIKQMYIEIFTFLDKVFSKENIEYSEYIYFFNYINDNKSDLNHHFKFSKIERPYYDSDEAELEIFFLRGKYGIIFDSNLGFVNKVKISGISDKEYFEVETEKAQEIYNQMKFDLKDYLINEYKNLDLPKNK